MRDRLRNIQHGRGLLLCFFGCALIASGLSGCGQNGNRVLPPTSVAGATSVAGTAAVAVATLPQPFDETSMHAIRGVLPIPRKCSCADGAHQPESIRRR